VQQPSLGDQELEVLGFVAENAPISVGEVAERFGEPRGLARTTVLTVMERLRKKGFLTRSKGERPFRYSPRVTQGEVLRGLVREFVEKTLGGSLSPFTAYLAEARDLSPAELRELHRLVEQLEAGTSSPRVAEERSDE
jgi:predicted transcriptional regulator